MQLGSLLAPETKQTLYLLADTPWDRRKPGIRVLALKQVWEQTGLKQALVNWITGYRNQRRLVNYQQLTNPEALAEYAFKKAKNSVAGGYGIEEAVSYWAADAVFQFKPYTNFNKVRYDIRQAIAGVLETRQKAA